MQKSIATMHPQFSSASGILGRMTESMSQGVNPYRSALYSMAGVRFFFVCGGCGVCGVCLWYGVHSFFPFLVLSFFLTYFSPFPLSSSSLFSETSKPPIPRAARKNCSGWW